MRIPKKRFVILLIVLVCLMAYFVYTLFDTDTDTDIDIDIDNNELNGVEILYYDFSKIPNNLILDRKIELPENLKKYLNSKCGFLKIENPERFEKEIWEEAGKLGYALDQFKNATIKQGIMAAVKIVAARFAYHNVDLDRKFIKKYGTSLSSASDVYFHLGLGDCDKYRDSTIAVFETIKKLNPKLQNVYLSNGKLGGNPDTRHAWVSILIPQDNYLILSHIDPTFYDSMGIIEADEFHICLEDNIFAARFYIESLDADDIYVCEYAYQLMYEIVLKTKNEEWQEELLERMSFIANCLKYDKPGIALKRALWVLEQYEARGFVEHLDAVLYHVYTTYQKAGNESKAEEYKNRLLKEFPDSFWVEWITDK